MPGSGGATPSIEPAKANAPSKALPNSFPTHCVSLRPALKQRATLILSRCDFTFLGGSGPEGPCVGVSIKARFFWSAASCASCAFFVTACAWATAAADGCLQVGSSFLSVPRVSFVYAMNPLCSGRSGCATRQELVSERFCMLQLSISSRSPLQTYITPVWTSCADTMPHPSKPAAMEKPRTRNLIFVCTLLPEFSYCTPAFAKSCGPGSVPRKYEPSHSNCHTPFCFANRIGPGVKSTHWLHRPRCLLTTVLDMPSSTIPPRPPASRQDVGCKFARPTHSNPFSLSDSVRSCGSIFFYRQRAALPQETIRRIGTARHNRSRPTIRSLHPVLLKFRHRRALCLPVRAGKARDLRVRRARVPTPPCSDRSGQRKHATNNHAHSGFHSAPLAPPHAAAPAIATAVVT